MNIIQNLTSQIRLKNQELSFTKTHFEKSKIKNEIRILQYRKEIEIIKDKIKKISK